MPKDEEEDIWSLLGAGFLGYMWGTSKFLRLGTANQQVE